MVSGHVPRCRESPGDEGVGDLGGGRLRDSRLVRFHLARRLARRPRFVRRGGRSELADDLVEPLPLDELHDEVERFPVCAHAEDRHNVRVVKVGGGASLAPEAVEQSRIRGGGGGQDLQRDVSSERFLDRLEHDAHTATTDLAEQQVIIQPATD
jgi:hypothetical protein